MKWKIISIVFTSILSIEILIHNVKVEDNNTNTVFNNINRAEEKITTKDNKSEINITYPVTKYTFLNKEIASIINSYQKKFQEELKYITTNNYYTLNISYQKYKYKNYISVILFTEFYTGGAHPNHLIKTINYDTKINKIITIDDLIAKDKNIIDKLSILSREYLSKNKIFNDEIVKEMMLEGTKKKKENFSNFAFTDNGLMILFERYQIAPYYFGDYHIIVPYSKLNLNI